MHSSTNPNERPPAFELYTKLDDVQKAIEELRRDVNTPRPDGKTLVENPWTTFQENKEKTP